WYSVDHSRLPEWMCDHFVQLSEDSETRDFLENCYEKSDWVVTQIYHSLAKAFLSWLLGRGSMFVFSRSHFQQLLGVSADWRASNLLDLGAGDGKVTEKMASFFSKVYVTETSPTMVSRLQEKQYRVLGIDQWDNGSLQYDVISCLNLLDRCDRPMSILRSMRRVLAPGGRPTERLNIDGATFEAQCESMVRDVFRPAGFSLLHFSRVPYLCEGDLHSSFYVLNDTVFVLTADDH
ncbi:METL9-like protein, partial [Mya arenaria]